MARVKRGTVSRRKHNKLLKLTKGYRGTRGKLIKVARETELHARAYSYHGRKLRKRNFRTLWITRIGEAVKKEGLSYNAFINKLKKAKIELDRKTLSDLALNDPSVFNKVIDAVKKV